MKPLSTRPNAVWFRNPYASDPEFRAKVKQRIKADRLRRTARLRIVSQFRMAAMFEAYLEHVRTGPDPSQPTETSFHFEGCGCDLHPRAVIA